MKSKLGYQALYAIILGILTGLFFGPYCNILKPIGDIFIILLQIIVIPYIPSLLMHGLGSLTPDLAKKLFRNGWPILLLLWVLVLVVCYIVKVLIPPPLPNPDPTFSIETSAFVSAGYGPLAPKSTFFGFFYNIVPIIALFSLLFGLAIMHLKEKEPLLGFLERLNNSFDKVIKWISIVSPIGIFAHIAHVMGTIHFDDLAKLQLYIYMVVAATLFLSLWVLPVLISCLTSIPLKEIYMEFRIVAFLPFATGIPTLALPYINNAMRRLAERKHLLLGTFRNTSQTIIPIGFGFAQIGNFVPLLFIFFLSFFYRHPLSDLHAVLLPVFTTVFSIGTPQFSFVALPFLLDFFHLPAEGFNLYAEISAITLNFQVLLSTASMLTFMYLVILKYYGLLEVHWRRLVLHAGSTIVLLGAFSIIGRAFIHTEDNYNDLYYNLSMDKAIVNPPNVTVYRERVPPPPTSFTRVLPRVLERKSIRVGYDVRNIPFCYLNNNNEVVGYDIAYAYKLAKDLEVDLVLVPLDYDKMGEDIASGFYDIAMSALFMDQTRILQFVFANPYLQQYNVLVVPNARIHMFHDKETVMNNPNIQIGSLNGFDEIVKSYFPQNNHPITDLDDFISGKIDAMMWSELPAYIWCLTHPGYTMVSYDYSIGKNSFAYPTATDAQPFINFLNEWMVLKKEQGFELEQRQYWFLGKSQTPENERWSVIRNVLHWIKEPCLYGE